MERRLLEHGFGPFYRENSRVLILGSFPSVRSREEGFYYGHRQNRFWKVLSAVFGEAVPETVLEKQALLVRTRVALYDVVERCSIVGSSDASIREAVPTDLTEILTGTQVGGRIFVNGKTALRLWERYQYPRWRCRAVCLPSTSPANAAWREERLTEAWKTALEAALGTGSGDAR